MLLLHLIKNLYRLLRNLPTSSLVLVFIVVVTLTPGQVLSGFACVRNPCINGICIDGLNSTRHQCYCINGFTGYSCEINWDECNVQPCRNGGTCIDGIASFNCSCPENYAGTLCEYDLSDCLQFAPCQHNGTCQFDPMRIIPGRNGTGFYCSCHPGFQGDLCQDDVSICNSSQHICRNGGKCIDGIGNHYSCQCAPGWEGPTCEINIDECTSAPCLNGGICIDAVNDFNCACPFSYTGKQCESKLEICPINPCQNGGFCLIENGNPRCYCVPDFHGKLCEDQYNECEPGPKCFNGGTCIDGVGGFNCSCPPGFFGQYCQCTEYNATDPECQPWWTNDTATVSYFPTPTPWDQTIGFSSTEGIEPTPTMSFDFTTILLPSDELSTSIVEDTTFMLTPSVQPTPEPPSSEDMTTMLPPLTPTPILPTPIPSPSISNGIPEETISSSIDYETIVVSPSPTPGEPEPSPGITIPGVSETTPISDVSTQGTTTEYESSTLETAENTREIGSTTITSEVTIIQHDNATTPYFGLTTLEYESTTVQSEVSTLESGTTSTQSEPVTAQSKPTTGQTDYTTVQSEVTTVQSEVTTVQSEVTTVQSEVTTVQSEVTTVQSEVTTMQSEVTTVQSEVTTVQSEVTTVQSEVTTVQSEVTTVQSEVTTVQSEATTAHSGATTAQSGATTAQSGPVTSQTESTSPDSETSTTRSITLPFEPSSMRSEATTLQAETSTVGSEISSPLPEVRTTESTTPRDVISESTTEILPPIITTNTAITGTREGRENDWPTDKTIAMDTTTSGEFGSTPKVSSDVSSGTSHYDLTTFDNLTPIMRSPTTPSSYSDATSVGTELAVSNPSSLSTTSEPIVIPGDGSSTPTTFLSNVTSSFEDACFNYCQNNAKCILDPNSNEPSCICSFKFKGHRCQLPVDKVLIPAFRGNSYLEYNVPTKDNRSALDVSLRMATVASDGILLYTTTPNNTTASADDTANTTATNHAAYALIFLQNGHVVLHFSCGSQSMEFIESRTRVNNGFNFTIHLSIQLNLTQGQDGVNFVYCHGRLSLNDSAFVMSGEQMAGSGILPAFSAIYVGGVHPKLKSNSTNDDIGIVPGFRGCLYAASVNSEQKDLHDDAVDGNDIAECESFACIMNPCYGNSKCVPSLLPPYWECTCPPGYVGVRCQIETCYQNPCESGATCTPSRPLGNTTKSVMTTGHNVTCLCPLGFSGSTCSVRVTITKPSFHGTEGFSSYMSYYGLPHLHDWFQMKFHFVTSNFSQVALVLYLGNSGHFSSSQTQLEETKLREDQLQNPLRLLVSQTTSSLTIRHRPIKDFYFLSFLQGYLALTWNLGSGTQRILTPSKIDPRLQIHTAYIGREGRQAWFKIDGMRNVSGKSPGPWYRLDVDEELFVGGHEGHGFDDLPHDLPLHNGFQGCVFDLGLRVKNKLFLPKALRGRNVKNCFEDC